MNPFNNTAFKLHKYLQKALGPHIKSVSIVDINNRATWSAVAETVDYELVKIKIREFNPAELEELPTTETKLNSLGLTKEELREYLGVK